METGKKSVGTTILIREGVLRDLRTIAKDERRSLGFLVRDAVDLWLAHRHVQGAVDESL